jgi:hypothetical protein
MIKTRKLLLIAVAFLLFVVGGASWMVYQHRVQSGSTQNCLIQRTGNVAIKVSYPPNLSGYPTSFKWPAIHSLLISKDDARGVQALVLEIRNRSEYWPLVDVIDHPDMAEHWSTSTFNGYDAAAMTGASGATYLIPVGNRVVQINYDHSKLSPSEAALADKMMQGITISTTTDDVPYDHERVDVCPK